MIHISVCQVSCVISTDYDIVSSLLSYFKPGYAWFFQTNLMIEKTCSKRIWIFTAHTVNHYSVYTQSCSKGIFHCLSEWFPQSANNWGLKQSCWCCNRIFLHWTCWGGYTWNRWRMWPRSHHRSSFKKRGQAHTAQAHVVCTLMRVNTPTHTQWLLAISNILFKQFNF